MTPVIVAFGSNLGDRAANIDRALRLLVACDDKAQRVVRILECSSIYETEPMYVENQPTFYNGVLVGETRLSPRELLRNLKEIERSVGRSQRTPNGPREIDLDLLSYGSLSYRWTNAQKVNLELPHPKIAERRFVLEPLNEIAPDCILPGCPPIKELLKNPLVLNQIVHRKENAAISVQSI